LLFNDSGDALNESISVFEALNVGSLDKDGGDGIYNIVLYYNIIIYKKNNKFV
jgi:hypothetical protein